MADSFDPLLIKIQSIADLKAVKDARNEMQLLQNQVPAGTELWKQLETSMKAMDDSMAKVANKTLPDLSENSEHSEKLMRQLHMATRMFGGQLGEVGHLVHAFTMGFGEIAALVITFREIAKAVQMVREAMALARDMSKEWAENIAKSSKEALASFKSEMEGWDTVRIHMFDANDELTTALENQLKLQQTIRNGINEGKDATKALNDALRALNVARGGETESQSQVEKLLADYAAKIEKEDREHKGKISDFALRSKRLDEMPHEAEEANRKAQELAAGPQTESQTRLNAAKTEEDAAKARADKAKDDVKKYQTDLDVIEEYKMKKSHPENYSFVEREGISLANAAVIALRKGWSEAAVEQDVREKLARATTQFEGQKGHAEAQTLTVARYQSELDGINADIKKYRDLWENRTKKEEEENVKYNADVDQFDAEWTSVLARRIEDEKALNAQIYEIQTKRLKELETEAKTPVGLSADAATQLNQLYIELHQGLPVVGAKPLEEYNDVSGMIVALAKEMRMALATNMPAPSGTKDAITALTDEIAQWKKRDLTGTTPQQVVTWVTELEQSIITLTDMFNHTRNQQ